ncbi:MAG: PEP-CTERM sorting domain-containing protein [Burkholderiales bacterium]|nr:PEP-CTERM sorting domain-containing protein [Burkholderiales bacterium]
MNAVKKALIASAVGMALAGTAQAGSVLFDVNGGAGANVVGVDQFYISVFDWAPGNLLIADTTPLGTVTNPVAIYSQSFLSSMLKAGGGGFTYGGAFPGQLTYQLRTWADATADGSAIQYAAGTVPSGSSNFFEIYYHTSAVTSDVTGCGYGANQTAPCGAFPGTLIYSGTADIVDTASLTQTGTTIGGLDQSSDGSDVDGGVTTRTLGLGTLTLAVNTVSYDGAFFLTDIDSLSVDIEHTEQGGGSPFKQANPSDQVVGNAPDYGDGINNIGVGSCGGAGSGPCDVHLQSDASSSVLTQAPEPQSLALLGLGLAAFGAMNLRRRAKQRS